MKRVLVVGIGRFGRAVVDALAGTRGVEVIAIDEQMGPVDEVRDKATVAARVDSIDREALEALGTREVDAAVVGIGEDFEAAVLTVAVLKEIGVREIVARATTNRRRRVLEAVGATRVVMAEAEMGRRVAHALVGSHVVDHLEIGPDVSLVQWSADGRAVGRTVRDLELQSRWELTLVAVKHHAPGGAPAETVTVTPPPTYLIKAGDVLLLCGRNARLQAFTG
jgi:trk system potassium uptake protein TrkA